MLCSRLMSKPVLEILNHHVGPGITFSSPSTVRFLIGNRHKDPKWKKFRALKVIPVDLPDFHKPEKPFAEMTPEEIRSHYKEKGIQPIRPWYERHITFSSSGNIVEPYVPPEGDEKKSPLNSAGAKQKLEWLKKKGKSWRELRTIRKYDDEFDLYPDFVEKAHDVYMKAHTALAENNHEDLLSYVTEKAYPEMVFGTRNKTIRWQFIKTLEPHRVSHVRTLELLSRENVFAQITVRFHTQQTLAIYDRFGRLIHGSETIAKDVLEYVVYEKQLSSEYGDWRLHGKIIPDWLPEKEPAPRTYIEVVDKEDESKTQAEAESDVSAPIVTVPSAGNEIAVPK